MKRNITEATENRDQRIYTQTYTGTRKNTKLRAILNYIKENGPVTKYEIVTKVLGKIGTRTELRGYYSTNMLSMRVSGMLNLDMKTRTYELTKTSARIVFDENKNPEYFV